MSTEDDFGVAYRRLESRMNELAESDGDVYVPNPEPLSPVQYILICMEPSLGRWARSAAEAHSNVAAGFRNFLYSTEDFILHFSAQQYLCRPGQHYYVTDLSKGAMLVDRAKVARVERYDRWYPLLQQEIDLVAAPGAGVIAVGKAVARHLEERAFARSLATVIHYSGQAAPARNAGIVGREDSFRDFSESVSLEDILATAERVLTACGYPTRFHDDTINRVARGKFSMSHKKLVFNYKIAFEAMRS